MQISDNNPLIEVAVIKIGTPTIVIKDVNGNIVSSVQTKIED